MFFGRRESEQLNGKFSSMPCVSLKDMLRKRVMDDMIKAVQPASKWKLLVVDSRAAKLLNSVVKTHEILEQNVTVIEEMALKRQPFPNYEAIYFVSPTVKSVDRIIADFAQEKPIYAAAHIFFTASLDDTLFDRIKKSGVIKNIKTLKEMNIDFVASEQQIFTLDHPLSLLNLYKPSSQSELSDVIKGISKRILSVLITLEDYPHIRYFDPTGTNDGICARLAVQLQKDLDDHKAIDDTFPAQTDYKRPVFIIVDRTIDMMAPFLHEFTYQAMVHDLIQARGEKGGDSSASVSGQNVDENDPIWILIRHWHFAEAVDYIRNAFQKFISENKAAAQALGGDSNSQGLDSLKQMKDTLSSLPQFQAMKSKFSVHINICQECKSLFERRRLDLVAGVQQDLATGETSEGKAVKNAMLDLIPVLDNKNTTPYDKLRALIIYVIAMDGIQDMERKRLLETAKIQNEESQALTNLAFFNVQLSAGQPKTRVQKQFDRYTYWGSHKVERKKRKKKADDAMPYDLSRYVPLLKRVCEDQIMNSLPKELFPWIKEPSNEELGIVSSAPKMFRFTANGLVAPDPNHPYSLRTTRASWVGQRVQKSKGKPMDGEKEEMDLRRNGPRVYMFALGGLTYSETRSAYELTRDEQREVFFGSTFIYSPSQFIDLLKHVHEGESAKQTCAGLFGLVTQTEEQPVEDKKEKVEKKGLFQKKK
ncbi:Sec1-like protein [Gorgonomyces haynaldii]|nr:Sec1-like protein [Gorgonomyces haynaldii]